MVSAIVIHPSEYWQNEVVRILAEAGIGARPIDNLQALQEIGSMILGYQVAFVGFTQFDQTQATIIAHLRNANVPVIILDAGINAQTMKELFRDHGVTDVLSLTDPARIIAAVQDELSR